MRTTRIIGVAAYLAFSPCFLSLLVGLSGCGGGSRTSSPGPALVEVQVSPSQAIVAAGQQVQFKAMAKYGDGSAKDVTSSASWTSGNPKVASVGSSGLVAALAIGNASVEATFDNMIGGSAVAVNKAQLASLAITPATSSLPLGNSQQLSATGTFTDGSTQDLTNSVTWESSDPAVASVTTAGMLQTKSVGTANLQASSGSVSATSQLTVSQHALVSVSVGAKSPTIALGTTTQLSAMGLYTDGTTADLTGSVVWSAAPAGILQISGSGAAKGVQIGQAQITAASGAISGAGSISVGQAQLVSLTVSSANASIPLGNAQQLTATGTFTDGSTQDLTSAVTWTSTQPAIAVVNQAGLVQSKSVGAVSLQASLGAVSATSQLTIAQHALVSLTVSTSSSTLALGTAAQVTARGTYTDATTADLTGSVLWSASPAGVVQLNAGTAKSLKTGQVTLTATSGTITGSGALTVTNAQLVALAVTPASPTVALGQSAQLKATGTFTDATTQDLTRTVSWASTQTGVATVNSAGLVQSKSTGTTKLAATLGSVSAATQLTVSKHALVSLTVSATTSSLALGTNSQLSARGTYTDNTTADLTTSVVWSAVPAGILQFGANGTVRATKVGQASISATSGAVNGSAVMTVTKAQLVSVHVIAEQNQMPLGTRQQLRAEGTYTDGSSNDVSSSVAWASSSSGTISVSQSGLVAAVSRGAGVISATAAGLTGAQPLTVTDPVLASLSISPSAPVISISRTLQFIATGSLTDGSSEDLTQSAAWSVSDPAVLALVNQGQVASQRVGSATIYASSGGIEASAVVTVQPVAATGYFINNSSNDSTLRIDNPGLTGQNLCAMIYVFDQDQQMAECCGCHISRNGLLTLSLKSDLVHNPLTGTAPASGTVTMVTADPASDGSCNAASASPDGLGLAWLNHTQTLAHALVSSEEPLSLTPLTSALSANLQAQCLFVQQLGSGQGTCSCGSEK